MTMYEQHGGPVYNGGSQASDGLPVDGPRRSNTVQAGNIQMVHLVKEISDLKQSASNLYSVPDALENLQETVSIMQDNIDALRKDVKKILSIMTSKVPFDRSLNLSRDSAIKHVVPGTSPSHASVSMTTSPSQASASMTTSPSHVSVSLTEPFRGHPSVGKSEVSNTPSPVRSHDHHVVSLSPVKSHDQHSSHETGVQRSHIVNRTDNQTSDEEQAPELPTQKMKEWEKPKMKQPEQFGHHITSQSPSVSSLSSVDNSYDKEKFHTEVQIEDVSLLRFKRKITDPNTDNRMKFHYEDAEIQMNSMNSLPVSEQVPTAQYVRQDIVTEVTPKLVPEHAIDQSETELRQNPSESNLVTLHGKVAEVKPVIQEKHLVHSEETELKVATVPPQPVAGTTDKQQESQSLPLENRAREEAGNTTSLLSDIGEGISSASAVQLESLSDEPPPSSASLDETIPLLEEMTLKEAARAGDCTDPKSQGADTIICVDTSDSMTGEPIEHAKTFITEFLDGIEEAAVAHGLEENIAIVTFGKETKVIQNLTNDYGKVRDAVDTLQTGGPSPMMTGLVLCLSAIFNRGGVVTYRDRKIQPRILLISDGKATDQRILQGEDVIKPPSSLTQVHEKLVEFAERLRNEPRTISCVPVGESDETIMRPISEITGGSMINPSKALHISRNFLLNTVAAKITTSGIFDQSDSNPERGQLEEMAKNQLKDIADQYHVNEVLRMVDEEVTKKRAEAKASANKNQTEAELLKNIPPVGTRVRRGPDWKWDCVDDNGPGTITAHKGGKGWVMVEWDCGNKGKFRYGADAAMDIQPVDEPRYLSDGEMAAVGVRVRRGPDWEWGNQDGGERSTGVIFKIEDSGIVHVRWDNGKRGNYRFGLFGKFDIEVCPGADSQSEQQNEELLGATASGITVTPDIRNRPQWQWKDDKSGQWLDHSQNDSERIEHLYKRGKGTILVTCGDESFRVVPQSKTQRNVSKGITNQIRRIEVPIG